MAKAHPFDPDLVRELARLLGETDLSEIEVEAGDLRIRVARTLSVAASVYTPAQVHASAQASAPGPAAPPAPHEAAAPAGPPAGTVASPMVGTAYRRPAPGAKPFVDVGSTVSAGEKVLLIEAMKTFNDIVAPRAGTVRAIHVEDGQPVEYGEALLVID